MTDKGTNRRCGSCDTVVGTDAVTCPVCGALLSAYEAAEGSAPLAANPDKFVAMTPSPSPVPPPSPTLAISAPSASPIGDALRDMEQREQTPDRDSLAGPAATDSGLAREVDADLADARVRFEGGKPVIVTPPTAPNVDLSRSTDEETVERPEPSSAPPTPLQQAAGPAPGQAATGVTRARRTTWVDPAQQREYEQQRQHLERQQQDDNLQQRRQQQQDKWDQHRQQQDQQRADRFQARSSALVPGDDLQPGRKWRSVATSDRSSTGVGVGLVLALLIVLALVSRGAAASAVFLIVAVGVGIVLWLLATSTARRTTSMPRADKDRTPPRRRLP